MIFIKKIIKLKDVNPQTEANKDLKAKVLILDIFLMNCITLTKKNMKKKICLE